MSLSADWLQTCPICEDIYRANTKTCPSCGSSSDITPRRKSLEKEKVFLIINLHNKGYNRVEIAEIIDDSVYKNIKKSEKGLKTFQIISCIVLGKTFKEYSQYIISDKEWKIRRFWNRFHKSYTVQEGCWIWNNKYSHKIRLQNIYIRRYLYEREHGKIEKSEKISTTCGNLFCVNPEHLKKLSSQEFYSLTGHRLNKFLSKMKTRPGGGKKKVKLISIENPSEQHIFVSGAKAAAFLNTSPSLIYRSIKTNKPFKKFIVTNIDESIHSLAK